MNDLIYREQIMDHFRNPRNFGEIKTPELLFTDSNPFCGDEITIQARIKNNLIEEIRFKGKGCAISQASTSMLTEFVVGKCIEEVLRLDKNEFMSRLGIDLGPVRIKCALLGLKALQKGLIKYLGVVENVVAD